MIDYTEPTLGKSVVIDTPDKHLVQFQRGGITQSVLVSIWYLAIWD